MTSLQEVIDVLNEICEDSNTTKNIKSKITAVVDLLKAEGELSMRVNRASHAVDELASNGDIDSFTRTQLLGVVSLLETVDEE